MKTPHLLAAGLACVALSSAAGTAAAATGTLTFAKDNAVWVSAADGTRPAPVTTGAALWSPSMDDAGNILALDAQSNVVSLTRTGALRGAPTPTWVRSGGSGGRFQGPFHLRVSPDGTKAVFSGYVITPPPAYPPGGQATSEGFSSYTDVGTYTEPTKYGMVKYGWTNGVWVDNTHTMEFQSVPLDPYTDVIVHELGHHQAAAGDDDTDHAFTWFGTPDAGDDIDAGALSRDGRWVATLAGEPSGPRFLNLYSSPGLPTTDPAAQPIWRCGIEALPQHSFTGVALSPDGQFLAFADDDGVKVLPLGSLSPSATCPTIADARLVAPGGSSPGYSPAAFVPAGQQPDAPAHTAPTPVVTSPAAPAAGPAAPATGAAALGIRRTGNAHLKQALARGLTFSVRNVGAHAAVTVELRLNGAAARRAHMKAGTVVARGRQAAGNADATTVTTRFTATARRRMRSLPRADLSVSAFVEAGAQKRQATLSFTLRR